MKISVVSCRWKNQNIELCPMQKSCNCSRDEEATQSGILYVCMYVCVYVCMYKYSDLSERPSCRPGATAASPPGPAGGLPAAG